MENADINITLRKDGRYMGKFCIGCDDSGKAMYQYVYGRTYEEAESKVMIGREVATRFLSGRCITVGKAYEEWLNAVVNRVKESSLANYKAKFEKHILPIFGEILCADLSSGRINAFINKKLAEGLSASYVRDIITVFKSMLRYAQEEYGFKLTLRNVVLPKTEKKQIKIISGIQQKKAYYFSEIKYVAHGIWYPALSLYGLAYRRALWLEVGRCGLSEQDTAYPQDGSAGLLYQWQQEN